MNIININKLLLVGTIGGALAFFPSPARTDEVRGEVRDIVCSGTQKQYAQPWECSPACPVRMAGSFGCALAPACPAWAADDQNLKVFYNAAVFSRGLIPNAKVGLVSHIINRYYRPHNASGFAISVVPERRDAWAALGVDRLRGGKLPLDIAGDAFGTSPAHVAQTIGHELIHAEQLDRQHSQAPINVRLLELALDALLELEASSWELSKNTFVSYRMGTNKFLGCITPQEREATELSYNCVEWSAKAAIRNVLTSPRGNVYGTQLRRWIEADPWAKRWFTTQADPTSDPGKRLSGCKQ